MDNLKTKPFLSGLALAIAVAIAFGAFAAGRSTTDDASGGDDVASTESTDLALAGSTGSIADPSNEAQTSGAEGTAQAATADPGDGQGVTVATVRPRPEIPVTVTTSKTDGLGSGDLVDVRVVPDPGAQIYGVEARVCAGDAQVELLADFAPTQMGLCALHALAPGANDHVNLPVPPPYELAEFSFTVGTGTDTYAIAPSLGGRQVSITCDRNNPCQLVVKLQVPDDVRFHSIPLTFA